MKYESSVTYHSKAMANVNVFADKQREKQTGQKVHAHPPQPPTPQIKKTLSDYIIN